MIAQFGQYCELLCAVQLRLQDDLRQKMQLRPGSNAIEVARNNEAMLCIENELRYQETSLELRSLWDKLMPQDMQFATLGDDDSMRVEKALTYTEAIANHLNWWNNCGDKLWTFIDEHTEQKSEDIFSYDGKHHAQLHQRMHLFIEVVRTPLIRAAQIYFGEQAIAQCLQKINSCIASTVKFGAIKCTLFKQLEKAALSDAELYARLLTQIQTLHDKKPAFAQRQELLQKLRSCAPLWANFLESHHDGFVPQSQDASDVTALVQKHLECLKYREINTKFDALYTADYGKLQHEAEFYSQRFRDCTAKLAAAQAWLAFRELMDNDPNLKNSLEAWGTVIKKSTSKNKKTSAMYAHDARRLAGECQRAIPAIIMPMAEALKNSSPNNPFDVVIIDEASQSDITAAAILFFAKKVIIVGDNEQVTPSTPGVSVDSLQQIKNQYFNKPALPFPPFVPLLDLTTSLYDLGRYLTNRQFMLREHFRCVKDIIGFSNQLSYDGKIVPLRESKSDALPPLVPYRTYGQCDGTGVKQINYNEAYHIVALIRSCMQQPEYAHNAQGGPVTYGIIIMKSSAKAQINLLLTLVNEFFTTKEVEEHQIRVGTPADFQGDERDIIFLSLLDSVSDGTTLRKLSEDSREDEQKKRYNVAVSRARDQLWVVHSFDPQTQLKPDDIRYRLFSYLQNPRANEQQQAIDLAKVESPFEEEVYKSLTARGYLLTPQYEVGSYRLDFMITSGSSQVALECDGERFHGEEQIAADMLRQSILERCGYHFVRIRGGEFYHDKKAAIDALCHKLHDLGIEPDFAAVKAINAGDMAAARRYTAADAAHEQRNQNLIERIKINANSLIGKVKQKHPIQLQVLVENDLSGVFEPPHQAVALVTSTNSRGVSSASTVAAVKNAEYKPEELEEELEDLNDPEDFDDLDEDVDTTEDYDSYEDADDADADADEALEDTDEAEAEAEVEVEDADASDDEDEDYFEAEYADDIDDSEDIDEDDDAEVIEEAEATVVSLQADGTETDANRKKLITYLQDQGCTVLEAQDGLHVVDYLKHFRALEPSIKTLFFRTFTVVKQSNFKGEWLLDEAPTASASSQRSVLPVVSKPQTSTAISITTASASASASTDLVSPKLIDDEGLYQPPEEDLSDLIAFLQDEGCEVSDQRLPKGSLYVETSEDNFHRIESEIEKRFGKKFIKNEANQVQGSWYLPSAALMDEFLKMYLKQHGYGYIEKRHKNGGLWVIADQESFKPHQQQIWALFRKYFIFAPNGSNTTDHQPAWFLRKSKDPNASSSTTKSKSKAKSKTAAKTKTKATAKVTAKAKTKTTARLPRSTAKK